MTDFSDIEFDQELEEISKRSKRKERIGLIAIVTILALVAGGMLVMTYKNWKHGAENPAVAANAQEQHAQELTDSRTKVDTMTDAAEAENSLPEASASGHSADTDSPKAEVPADSPVLGPKAEPPVHGPELPPELVDNLQDEPPPQKSKNMAAPKKLAKSLCSRATAMLVRGKRGSFDRAYVYANGADWMIDGVNFNNDNVCEVAGATIPDPCFEGAPGKHKASQDCPPRERLY